MPVVKIGKQKGTCNKVPFFRPLENIKKGRTMILDISRDEAWLVVNGRTTAEILDSLEEWGIEFRMDLTLDDMPRGVYRREEGMDLITNSYGDFRAVNIEGLESEITWACFNTDGDWWIRVLDEDNRPVWAGDRFKVDHKGNRLK